MGSLPAEWDEWKTCVVYVVAIAVSFHKWLVKPPIMMMDMLHVAPQME
jgi:hypothetical protein